jgi:glutathione synthase/RimK-type ligase-like ATP-grasp enzyme
MQKVLIIISWQPEDGPTAQKYKQYARQDQDVTVRRLDSFFVAWDGKELQVVDRRGEIRLDDFDVVHLAGWQHEAELGYVLANWLEAHHIPFVGRTLLDWYPGSKVGEMTRLTLANVPYPKSFFAANNADLVTLFDWAHDAYGLMMPVVVKGTTASKGDDNHLVQSRDELAALTLDETSRYIMQEAIPNDCDYRVLVLGGEVKLIIRRTRVNQDSHLNNTAQGAKADVVEAGSVPGPIIETALAAAIALGRTDVAGVDILIDKDTNDLYVLEVNKTPHLSLGSPDVIETKLRSLFDYLHTTIT